MVIGGKFRDDAIAIESCLGKYGLYVGRVGKRNYIAFLVEVGKNLSAGVIEFLSFGVLLIKISDVKVVGTFEQEVGILDGRSNPLSCCNYFVHTYTSITVGINVFQTFFLNLQARCGA